MYKYIIIFGSYLILFILSIKTVESRSLDGSDNNLRYPDNGKPLQPYMREFPSDPFYPDGEGKMLKSPASSMINCTDPLPEGTYPSPRCIFDQFTYNLSLFDVKRQSELRSNRKTSHMVTWFGHYISFDISSSSNGIPLTQLYIPADDANYNPPDSIPITKSLPFNSSGPDTPDTPDTLNSVRNGVRVVTPFLDLNMIYGLSDDDLKNLRDGTSCKLLTSNNGKYPSKDIYGMYKWGINAERALTLFTLAINTVWIREHNRQCDELFEKYGNSWTDQQYFEESRRWTIALYQKTVSEEYLGVVTGHPLPAYEGYKSDIIPGIDTFFSTVTFRYGHTELSDKYRIQNEYGDTIVDLTLSQIINQNLVEIFGLSNVLRSMALQRQEEIDIFFSDSTRNFVSMEPNVYDIPAFDVLRSRERGIALYNTVREAYGLERKSTWSEVTSNVYLQNRLQFLYPNGPDAAESFVGAFCEDHVEGSNFGQLLNESIVRQFNRIRETDRFWWESNEMFNEDEKSTLRNTTFHDIIVRNLKIDDDGSQFIRNLWMVQPNTELVSEDDEVYKTQVGPWSLYSIRYYLDNTYIHFKVEFQTTGGEGWFGMGFDPSDLGMKDAEFIVGIVKNNDIELSNYDAAAQGYHPPEKRNSEGLEIKNKTVTPDGKATILFDRLLDPPNRKKILNKQMKYIMAYNPMSSVFGYHEHNRQMILINFYTSEISATSMTGLQIQNTRFFHGLGMFLAWCVLFPISIFIVRFFKHTNNYLKIHRIIQLLGGVSVSTFGAAAIATMSNTNSSHAWMGLVIYFIVFFQLGLGLAAIWGQGAVVSVNQGYPRFCKRAHKGFGAFLLLASWVNIYLGIDTYTKSESKFFVFIYVTWTFLLIMIFLIGEYRWRKGATNKLDDEEKNAEIGGKKNMLEDYINHETYDKLPEFIWEEVNERVQRGASLVVCNGLVIDIRKWIKVHPGGAKILEKVIGTDITNDFYGKNNVTKIVEDVETDSSLLSNYKRDNKNTSIIGKYDDILIEKSTTENPTTILNKCSNMAKVIDNINLKHFSKSPLANHSHSAFATKKMLDLVIGKMNENYFKDQTQNSSLFESKDEEENIMTNEFIQRIKFRRYKLTSKSAVNSSISYPVIRFTFTKVHQDDVRDERFLPGHFIEVKSRIKGQIVIRGYTPIEGKMSKSFSIYVKVYPNGLMSTHLNERLIGFEIQVRGPFDVSDRIGSGQEDKLNSPLLRKRGSFALPSPVTPMTFATKSSLLNPDSKDGCWEELFMICWGTGITPMLQLIKYHLIHIRKSHDCGQRNRRINMYLLFGNKRIEDIIDGIRLEEYALLSRGMLTINFILSEPPEEWKGLEGMITPPMLKEWLEVTIPTSSTSQNISDKTDYGLRLRGYNIPRPPTIIDDINLPQINLPQPSSSSSSYLKTIDDSTLVESPIEIPQNIQSTPIAQDHPFLKHRQIKRGEKISISVPKYVNKLQSKTVVCGPMEMMMIVDKTLIEMGYSQQDYILLL
ncbi:hypothetical protein RclHR1_06650002 [Rhizophagus clarus]|uniref:Cytochrome b5 heme-binding domain-containing protein n=1 Tax=Rhizophagus clarus TaxID=94130 RepID=A0A2Z6SAK9_9GLOM|nr:hypothetical protein RclHR1_06650002 [Rhizophagus clarus]